MTHPVMSSKTRQSTSNVVDIVGASGFGIYWLSAFGSVFAPETKSSPKVNTEKMVAQSQSHCEY
eukprot:3913182-Amphidinium_carterae.1